MAQQATLYSFPIAFNPAKALLALEEKGLKNVRIQNVNLFNGASLQPWYMKISPGSTAPALVVGGRTLTQTRDILQWVDEQGEPLGGSQVDRALVTQLVDELHAWDGNLFAFANVPAGAKGVLASLGVYKDRVAEAQKRKAEAAGDKELAEAYRKKIESAAASRAEVEDSAKVEANKQQLGKLLDRAEELLAKNKYLAGSAFSMADVVLACIVFRLSTVNQTKQWLEPRPKLSNYYYEIKNRPACKKVFGPPSSPLTAMSCILPAAIKAKVARLTGWYA